MGSNVAGRVSIINSTHELMNKGSSMQQELFQLLVCPVHRTPLTSVDLHLSCAHGCSFPVLGEVPFLLPRGTLHSDEPWAQEFFEYAEALLSGKKKLPPIPETGTVDDHVQDIVGATNSAMYRSLVGRLTDYPIPHFPLDPRANGDLLLDIGCNWGRWCFAAARAGFMPLGIDPSLRGVLAANRIARQLGIRASFVCGDSRYMPFKDGIFDAAYSFSVLQHLSKTDVALVLKSLRPVMKPGAITKLHLLNCYGLRSLQVQLFRLFMKPFFFQTRYWSPNEMLSAFSILGPSYLEVDGFFVQGRYEERHLFNLPSRLLTAASRWLKELSARIPFLQKFADNLFVVSVIK